MRRRLSPAESFHPPCKKLLILLISGIGGPLFQPPFHEEYLFPPSLSFVLVIFLFGAASVLLVTGFLVLSGRVADPLIRPSLCSAPYRYDQPLLSFDTGALGLIAYALSGALYSLIGETFLYFWTIPFFAGLGAWFGVRICVKLYA